MLLEDLTQHVPAQMNAVGQFLDNPGYPSTQLQPLERAERTDLEERLGFRGEMGVGCEARQPCRWFPDPSVNCPRTCSMPWVWTTATNEP